MRLGILPLARSTFDIDFANKNLSLMLTALDANQNMLIGTRQLLLDETVTEESITEIYKQGIDQLLILQVTFTDASMAVRAATVFQVPLSIWAVPEPRTGGRLRLNSFCGLNLASHALGLKQQDFSWIYSAPHNIQQSELTSLFNGERKAGRLSVCPPVPTNPSNQTGKEIIKKIHGKQIARIGNHPNGFHTCAYDAKRLKKLAGVTVDEIPLKKLFTIANTVHNAQILELRLHIENRLSGLEQVNQSQLNRSLQLKIALQQISKAKNYNAFAIRCWPETFTEFGGAICGPISMLGEKRLPCACEADVYGALTQLILQEVADAAVFLTDIVDIDIEDNSGVIWHCGQAPISMYQNKKAIATVHSNRKMPLLYQFPLKPGTITFMRISQAFGEIKMIIAKGEILQRPMAFSGTSGVFRFEKNISAVLQDIISCGMEHHIALTYGDHCTTLIDVANAMELPILRL